MAKPLGYRIRRALFAECFKLEEMSAIPNTGNGQLKLSLEPERRIYRVGELNAEVQRLFEAAFGSVWIAGEISGVRQAASGHYYFALKDETSQLKCVLFKSAARFTRAKPQDGLAVIARGRLEVYEARGEYQLLVESLEPQGAGALQLAFEQLKKKLAGEGLFEAARKRPLPKLPRRIGLITSPSGAVIRDMLHVLERRFRGLHIRLFPARVQGEGAAEQVCAGLRFFSQSAWADVVILARGGGSLEDLWTFNEEAVARAIAASQMPVISAIGHETDFTIADFVADHRAPTPSAAAEIVIATTESLLEQIAGCRSKIVQAMRYRLLIAGRDLQRRGTEQASRLIQRRLANGGQTLDELYDRLLSRTRAMLAQRARAFDGLAKRLAANDFRLRFARSRHSCELLERRLRVAMETRFSQARQREGHLAIHLQQMSPFAVLARGYAIVEKPSGQVVRSAAETQPGDALRIRLHRGELAASVTESREGTPDTGER